MSTFTGPGRGRKQCPACKIYVGVRSHSCPCGHAFKVIKNTYYKVDNSTPEAQPSNSAPKKRRSNGKHQLYTPAGKCPVPLAGTDEDSVLDWMSKLEKEHLEYQLMAECFQYWAKTLFRSSPEDYKLVCEYIDRNL